MLHRSFKPAKCKTALKLAIPRLKLMKNKREAQVRQFRRELAQLLESGQDQTARIRVEHVVREEKTVAAYNLLEIYCELIVARMPIIESQKECPIDLKEAITSVIFASKRCEDIPELKDVSKHFTAKYGKEFTSAAVELRPNCGVGRMLVEKLSAKAPDGPTKLKILTEIAEEHKIKWDPESFGAKEAKPYDDLLNGPNDFKEASKISADPHTRASNSYYEQRPPGNQVPIHDKGPPNVQAPIQIEKNDASASIYQHKNFDNSNSSASNQMSSGTYPPNSKPYGIENQVKNFGNSYPGNDSAFSSPRQNWNMEFRDATAAAQAAAESAELASMAARAAAELSSRGNISQQYSTESHMSSSHGRRDEELHQYTGSASQNEHLARHRVVPGGDSRNYERTDNKELHNRAGEAEHMYSNIVRSSDKSTHGSFKSSAASFNEKPSVNNHIGDAYSQRNSSEGQRADHLSEASIRRNSGENGMQSVGELHDSKDPRNVNNHEARVREQSSYSLLSQSNMFSDDHDVVSNLNWQSSENDERSTGKTGIHFVNELHDTKNSENANYQDARIRKQSSYSSSHSHSSTSTDEQDVVSSLNHQKSGSNIGEESPFNDKGSHQRSPQEGTDSYDNATAVFDDYGSDKDEYNFDLEEEHKVHEYSNLSSPGRKSPTYPFTSTNSWRVGPNVESPVKSVSQSGIFSEQQSTPEGPSHVDDLSAAFDDYGPSSESEEEVKKSKFGRSTDASIFSDKNTIGSRQSETSISPSQSAEGMEGTEPNQDFSLEESQELNLGNLTGGLRNKGYRRPPYSTVPHANTLPSGEAAGNTSSRIKQSSPATAVEASVSSGSYNQEPYRGEGSGEVYRKLSTRASRSILQNSDSSDDDSEEEQPKQPFKITQEPDNKMPSFEENKKSRLRVPATYFGSVSSDSYEELPVRSSNTPLNTGLSRRTKAPPPNSRRSSYASEALSRAQPQKRNSDQWESNQRSWLAEQATSKPVAETKMFEPSRSSEKEQQAPTFPEVISSSSARTLKAESSIREGSSKENANVHLKTTVTSSRSSDSDGARPRTQPQKKSSDYWESNQQSRLAAQATSELVSDTKKSSFDGPSMSSEKERRPPTSVPKIVSSGSAKTSKAQISTVKGSSKENASHVHPKLPDYDSLMEHFSSLKQNRR